MDYLLEYTALDPRFRTLSHLQDEEDRADVYRRLKEKAVQFYNQVFIYLFTQLFISLLKYLKKVINSLC